MQPPSSGHSGDPQFATWIHSVLQDHEATLLRYAARLTGDADRARDVVQETFLRLCRENPDDLDGHLAPWLFRVCRQRALDVRRKENRMAILSEQKSAQSASPEAGPAETVARQETHGAVAETLNDLPPNQQEVVRLKFQHGMTYRQISEVTELSVSNVGYLLHTALKTLRARLASESDSTPKT